MRRRLVLVGIALAALRFPKQVCAQFTDPRTYDNTPVGANQLELGYGYVHANTSIDTSLVVAGASLDFNQGYIDYTRYFSFLRRLAWVEPVLPLAGLNGSISGTNIQRSATGAGDQKWELDGYANIYFYTDNTSYRGTEVLRQEALPGVEGHISYSLTNNLWASLDTRYSFRGDTFVNGANQNDPQENFILGSELNVSLNSRSALVFAVGRALVHVNGSAYTGFAVRYDYSWSKSYR